MMNATPTSPTLSFDHDPHRMQVGDYVMIGRDVLAELGQSDRLAPVWFCVPAGTDGRLIGWRERESDSRAILEILETDRLIVFVGERHLMRTARPVERAPRPAVRRTRRRH